MNTEYVPRVKVKLAAPLSVLVAVSLLTTGSFAQSRHGELKEAAWIALVDANYSAAISIAEKCIGEFKLSAKDLQAQLERAGKTLPSGSVTAEAKQAISANGPLNDVATCYFIIGEAHRRFVHTDPAKLQAARAAYEEARRLNFGRCILTNGVVWVPAERAALRLEFFASITNRFGTVSGSK